MRRLCLPLSSNVRHLDLLMSSISEKTDRWLVILNPYAADGLPSTRCGPAFFRLLQSLNGKIIETTPRTQFEAFPHAMSGYNLMLVRFRHTEPEEWQFPEEWLDIDHGAASIVLSGAKKPSSLEVIHRKNCSDELWDKFVIWLNSNKRWLWKPRY